MPCVVIVIGRSIELSRSILEAAGAGPRTNADAVIAECGKCKNTTGVVYRADAAGVIRPVLFDPKLAEFFVFTFHGSDRATQLERATTWLAAEKAWLDDPNKTIFVIQEEGLP